VCAVAVAALAFAGCGGDDGGGGGGRVSPQVAEHLKYLDPQSSAVVVIDARYEGENLKRLRPVLSRLLRVYGGLNRAEGDFDVIPPNVEGALELAARSAGLSFEDDVEPALDGHLVVGWYEPPRREGRPDWEQPDAAAIAVYRTEKGDLRRIVDKVAEGDRLKPVPGHEDARMIDDDLALVGDDTLVFASYSVGGLDGMRGVLDRAKADRGFPLERLANAERDVGVEDPLVLATGDLTALRPELAESNLRRAQEEVPYLRALRRASAALTVHEDRLEGIAHVITDPNALRDEDLPVAGAGDLELPEDPARIVGASRDQSRTTVFASRLVRAAFADSRFARAVARTERALGIRFEDEVLRQFDCPSASALEPRGRRLGDDPNLRGQPFAARSCVRDPERMRRLLPRLEPHLPAIVKGLQGLGDEGLVGLLLIAPDAPLTPSVPLAAVDARPLPGGPQEEQLYEISGLHDDPRSEVAQAGPERVVFGLIGETFVVASDRAMARRAAAMKTTRLEQDAGSAIRVPAARLLERRGASDEERALARVIREVTVTFDATRERTTARARIPFQP
jgi:hypothetical protein